jgi:hypothetical protein
MAASQQMFAEAQAQNVAIMMDKSAKKTVVSNLSEEARLALRCERL